MVLPKASPDRFRRGDLSCDIPQSFLPQRTLEIKKANCRALSLPPEIPLSFPLTFLPSPRKLYSSPSTDSRGKMAHNRASWLRYRSHIRHKVCYKRHEV